MSLSYARLRQLHFRMSLADQFRGIGRTVIIVAGFLGGAGVLAVAEMLTVLANGLMALTYSFTAPVERLGVVLGWQLVTLGLLWTLRRVMFMQDADSFLSALPIPERSVWRADLLIAIQCYSILWLPLGWLLYVVWRRLPPTQALLACVLRIPIKPATDSTLKPATCNAPKPATRNALKPASPGALESATHGLMNPTLPPRLRIVGLLARSRRDGQTSANFSRSRRGGFD